MKENNSMADEIMDLQDTLSDLVYTNEDLKKLKEEVEKLDKLSLEWKETIIVTDVDEKIKNIQWDNFLHLCDHISDFFLAIIAKVTLLQSLYIIWEILWTIIPRLYNILKMWYNISLTDDMLKDINWLKFYTRFGFFAS